MEAIEVSRIEGFPGEVRTLAEAQSAAGLGGTLFAAGNLEVLRPLRVSIAGTRRAEPGSLAAIEALAGQLAAAGATVVSGGAVGTDCAAHRGALDRGGATIVVVPCSLAEIDPEGFRADWRCRWDLSRTLFLSPFPPGYRPTRGSPIVRNRLIASLAEAAVVGQTGIQGGTNHFLSLALESRTPTYYLDAGTEDEMLRLALRTLGQRGARKFKPDAALDGELAREILRSARDYRAALSRAAASQQSLFPPDEQVAP